MMCEIFCQSLWSPYATAYPLVCRIILQTPRYILNSRQKYRKKLLYLLKVPLCLSGDRACVASVGMPEQGEGQCLRPCEGLFVDVKRSQASTIQKAKLQILRNEYTNYTSFQESYNTEKKMIMGNTYMY